MGLWGGSNSSIQSTPTVKKMTRGQIDALAEEQQIFNDARSGMAAERISERKILAAKIRADASGTIKSVAGPQSRFALGKNVGQAALAGMQQQRPTFSREQEMMGEMFGGGSKIWGTNQEPVRINNDLNSSRSDPFDETSSMFGWGGQSERSGLF